MNHLESKNKKIRNATPVNVDGIQFRSKLEANFYMKAKELDLLDYIKYEPFKIELQPEFTYQGQKYRPITWTPDFILYHPDGDILCEIKGHPNDAWPMKLKMILYWMASIDSSGRKLHSYEQFMLLKSNKDINNFLKDIKDGRFKLERTRV